MSKTADQLAAQWANPGDIMSLLLLIGGDIVQKAIAQLVGHSLSLGRFRLPITPVAFSFGWAAYAFTNMLAAFGRMSLMPETDSPSMVVNCSNCFTRTTQSWSLGRLLRDHEIRCLNDPRIEDGGPRHSLRIDIFNLERPAAPSRDLVWWAGWLTIITQISIAIIPWAVYDDWGVMLITLCGTALAAVTCSLPQWEQEKWPGRVLDGKHQKVTCITRGNGYQHIMVLIGLEGSWDLESMATGISMPRLETRWLCLVLAIGWTCLLITIPGLQTHSWFLIGIGGLGMLQNIFTAGTSRIPGASGLHLTPFARAPTIIGLQTGYDDDSSAEVDIQDVDSDLANLTQVVSVGTNDLPPWVETMSSEDGAPAWLEAIQPYQQVGAKRSRLSGGSNQTAADAEPAPNCLVKADRVIYAAEGVHGALMELEKWVPTAGIAMLQTFFAGGLSYNDGLIRDNKHRRFWKRAYHTARVRKQAEEKRRAAMRKDFA